MEKLNTHFYDHQIKKNYDELIARDQVPPTADFHHTVGEMIQYVQQFPGHPRLKQQAHASLMLFLRDSKNNMDHNGIRVEDLLPRIWAHMNTQEVYFLEQLADISASGPCNNGRINRLLQIYACLV